MDNRTLPFQNVPERAQGQRRVSLAVPVSRADGERGILWGWVSAAEVEDSMGDVIPQAELINAVYAFMESYYDGAADVRLNHGDDAVDAVIVESTIEMRAGVACWWVGVKLRSESLREMARAGKIKGFSIGGYAVPEE